MVKNSFAISRKLFENSIWYLEPFTKGQAWIDLIGNANYVDNEFMIRGNVVKVKRGQLGWSELTMAERWKWSRGKVKRFLSWLESKQQIVQQKSTLTTIITILNYEDYQFSINGTGQQANSSMCIDNTINPKKHQKTVQQTVQQKLHQIEHKTPTSVQQTVQQTVQQANSRRTADSTTDSTQYNKVNKDNKVNKHTSKKDFAEESIEYELSKHLYEKILEKNPEHKKPNLQEWSQHVDYMIRLDKRTPEKIGDLIDWCQDDSFWQDNILSTAKLREKFDQLVLKSKRTQREDWRISNG